MGAKPTVYAVIFTLLIAGPGSGLERRDAVDRCERAASRAACDPDTGYIAGPNGPCAPTDLACVRDAWARIGDPSRPPLLGPWCGRNHEDGGTLVPCDGAGGGGAFAPPPPPPPTQSEAQGFCPELPLAPIHTDPAPDGLTGLETRLWSDPAPPRSASGSIRGYPVTCTATAESWRWATGDGRTSTSAGPGGPPPAEAVRHTYERRDTYELTLVVTWRLDTNYGTGRATRTSRRDYHVAEIRSVLVP